MNQLNTKHIRSFIFRNRLFFWIGTGAVVAALIGALAVNPALDYFIVTIYIVLGILAFLVFVVVALIAANRASAKFKRQVSAGESVAALPLDQDDLKPLDKEKHVYLGNEWILLRHESSIRALPKNLIRSVDSHVVRKPGMEQLWIHILTTGGESLFAMYKACTPDVLETVVQWLNQNANPSPVQKTAASAPMAAAAPAGIPAASSVQPSAQTIQPAVTEPAAEPQKPIELVLPDPITTAPESVPAADGICPYCTGPNEAGQTVCQWCGKPLK